MSATLPDEFAVFAGLVHAPDGSGAKLAAILLCHCGSLDDGERAAQPITRFGAPVLDGVGAMPYCQVNMMLDAAAPRGALNYWKSSFLSGVRSYQSTPRAHTRARVEETTTTSPVVTARSV